MIPISRGRLAPSPTGAQHVGNARTYLIAWLAARSVGGEIVLRMEDIDGPRIKTGAAKQALDDLRWLRLDWDGEPVVQSTRVEKYLSALERLKSKNLVYPCTCTRSDVAAAASAPNLGDEGPAYPGTCSFRTSADVPTDRPYCWRFRVHSSPSFVDGYRGLVEIDLKQQGCDFVIWKTDGTPAYQLAVVVDDAEMGITQVVRGDDLIPSTPRQLLLYQALNLKSPSFIHLPLVVGTDGRRLAKRHGDTRLQTLRDAGVKPEMLIGLLAWSCGWINQIEPVAPMELLKSFDVKMIPQAPFVLTNELLSKIGFRQK